MERAAAASASGRRGRSGAAKARIPVPSGLVKHEPVARLCGGVGDDPPRIDQARDREARLDLVVLDAVPADDRHAGLGHLVQAAAEDLAAGPRRELVARETRRSRGPSAAGRPSHKRRSANWPPRSGRTGRDHRPGARRRRPSAPGPSARRAGRRRRRRRPASPPARGDRPEQGSPASTRCKRGLVDFRAAAGIATISVKRTGPAGAAYAFAGARTDVLAAEDFAGAGLFSDRRCNVPTASSVASHGGVFPGPSRQSVPHFIPLHFILRCAPPWCNVAGDSGAAGRQLARPVGRQQRGAQGAGTLRLRGDPHRMAEHRRREP